MLTISPIERSPGGTADYLLDGLPYANYALADASRFQPVWYGKSLHEVLGSSETERSVFREDLISLLAGFRSDGTPIVANAGKAHRRTGYDLTMSAPKPFSALWALSPPHGRKLLEEVLMNAVTRTLEFLETRVPLARVGKCGHRTEMASLVAAPCIHVTSRSDDPQLHVHVAIMNLCRLQNGKWQSINSKLLHHWTPALGRIFRANLAKSLTDALPVQLYMPQSKTGEKQCSWQIHGIPEKLLDRWSTRRNEIDRYVGRRQAVSPQAKAHACLETRVPKSSNLSLDDLTRRWHEEAAELGIAAKELAWALQQDRPQETRPSVEEAIRTAIADLERSHSYFRDRDVIQRVCEALQAYSFDGNQLADDVTAWLSESKEVLRLNTSVVEPLFTTSNVWEMEKLLLNDVKAMTTSPSLSLDHESVEQVLAQCPDLSNEQRTAATNLLIDNRGVRILNGAAGTGKSRTLNAIRLGAEEAGYRVIGATIAGAAKRELASKTGITSTRTVASYLYHLDKFTNSRRKGLESHSELTRSKQTHSRGRRHRKTVRRTPKKDPVKLDHRTLLVIEEAAVLDTFSMHRLIHHARKCGSTVLLCGDTRQLPPVEGGCPMHRLESELGCQTLRRNQRQQNPLDRVAVSLIRENKLEDALRNYAQRDRLHIAKDREAVMDKIIDKWIELGGTKSPDEHVILTETRADARYINQLCQQERLITGHCVPTRSVRHEEYLFCVGDRVTFREKLHRYGIENGFTGTVADARDGELDITLDQDCQDEPSPKPTQVSLKLEKLPPGAISLAYASTTHSYQGRTCSNSLILMGTMTSREMFYSQATRARLETHLFVDRFTANDELKHLIRSVSRSRAKFLAHDIKEQELLDVQEKRDRDRQPEQYRHHQV